MKKIISLVIIMVMLVSMTSCGDKKQQNTDENKQTLKNGELVIIDNDTSINIPAYDFDTFNPITTKSSIVADDMKIVYEPLFDFDSSLNTIAVLASGYSVSDDGLRFVISLKQGVKWHDGDELTASDVNYTIKSILQNTSSLYYKNLQDIVGYNIADTYTYIITLKRPIPNFVGMLNFPIVKNQTNMAMNFNYIPIGTGPYKYKDKQGTNKVNFVPNTTWHGGQAKMKNIMIEILKDKTSAVYAFEASELQCITSKTLDLTKYTPKGTVKTIDYTSNDLTFLGMNFYKSVLWGTSTRQAIGYLIDKDEIVNSAVYDRGVVVDVPINPSAWFYNPEKKYCRDTQQAESLLANDGWVKNEQGKYKRDFNGTEQLCALEILVNSESEEKLDIANKIAFYLNSVGMSITMKSVPYSDYSSLVSTKNFDIFIGEVTMSPNIDPTFLIGSGGNYFTYVSQDMDLLIQQIGKTQDKEEYKRLYTRFGEIFNVDMPFVPLFFRKDTFIYSSKIAGNINPTFYNVYKNVDSWYMYKK